MSLGGYQERDFFWWNLANGQSLVSDVEAFGLRLLNFLFLCASSQMDVTDVDISQRISIYDAGWHLTPFIIVLGGTIPVTMLFIFLVGVES